MTAESLQASNTSQSKMVSLFESVTATNPKPVPKAPPDLEDFRKLSIEKRREFGDRFFAQAHIQEYIDQKWAAELHNRDAIFWLCRYRDEFMTKENEVERKAVNTKLSQFLNIMGDQKTVFNALRLDMKALGLVGHVEKNLHRVDWND